MRHNDMERKQDRGYALVFESAKLDAVGTSHNRIKQKKSSHAHAHNRKDIVRLTQQSGLAAHVGTGEQHHVCGALGGA